MGWQQEVGHLSWQLEGIGVGKLYIHRYSCLMVSHGQIQSQSHSQWVLRGDGGQVAPLHIPAKKW